MKILSIILLATFFLTGYGSTGSQNSAKHIPATECKKSLSNSEMVDCVASEPMRTQQTSTLEKLIEIDEKYPGPEKPDIQNLESTNLFDVKRINNHGIILLENGVKLKLAGIKCSIEEIAVKYIRTSFLNTGASKLAYTLSGYTEDQYKYAYVWVIDSHARGLGFLDKPNSGPSLTSLNEFLIITGLCKPIKQEKHLYHLRYERLEGVKNEL